MLSFDNIHSDLEENCNCIEDLTEDLENFYIRRISKKTLKDNDLKTHWERGKRPEVNSCTKNCDYKGLSINLVNDEVMEFYRSSHTINPNIKYLCKFKFHKEAGVIKGSPIEGNPNHMNFFKCDTFTKEKLKDIEIIEL